MTINQWAKIFICSSLTSTLLIGANTEAGKLRDFESTATGKNTRRQAPPDSSGNSSDHRGGSSNNSRNDHYDNYYRRDYNKRRYRRYHDYHRYGIYHPYRDYVEEFYIDEYGYRRSYRRGYHLQHNFCRRPQLFHSWFGGSYRSSCNIQLVRREHVYEKQTDTEKPEDPSSNDAIDSKIPEKEVTTTTTTKELRLESLRSSLMLNPSIRLDLARGQLDSTIDLDAIELQLAYDYFSIDIAHRRLVEDIIEDEQAFRDTIKISNIFVNYRQRLGDYLALSIGVGNYDWNGVFDFSESAWQLKTQIHSPNGFGFELTYIDVLGGSLKIRELDTAIFYGKKHFSGKLGIRTFQARRADSTTLSGSYLGLSLRF